MYYFIITYMYRALSYCFYYIGDIASRIPTEWSYYIYQIAMRESIKYDGASGNNIWKEVE